MPTPAASFKPDDMSPVSPHLICRGAADAIDFYVKAFGAVERRRTEASNGKIMNAVIEFEGASIMLVDENLDYGMKGPLAYDGSPVSLHVYVPDVDDFVTRAEQAGGTIIMPRGRRAGIPAGRPVLGRPFRDDARSLRPCLVVRDPQVHPDAGRTEGGGDGRGRQRRRLRQFPEEGGVR